MPEERGHRLRNIPLPEVHLGLIAVGLAMDAVRPWRIVSRLPAARVGWPLSVAGVALVAWATRSARDVELERPDRIVTSGPYALSRHPMYAGWTLIYVGLALVRNTAWLLMLLPLLTALIHRESRREEDRLARVFGPHYEGYRARVRRYL